MRRLVFSMNVSLDGYMEDATGNFGWSKPDDEVHQFVNDEQRAAGGGIYGRRMWDTMKYWATADTQPEATPVAVDFARIWQAMPKWVASRTLDHVEHGAELLRDPAAEVPRLKEQDGGPLYVGGAGIAGDLMRQGLVDELHAFAFPVVVGGGKPAWTTPARLELIDSRTFASGVVHSRYKLL